MTRTLANSTSGPGPDHMTRKSLAMIFQYALRKKREFVFMVVFMGLGIGSMMVSPQIFRRVINLLEAGALPTTNIRDITSLLGLGIAVALVGALLLGLGRYFSAIVGTEAQYEVRKDVYNAINRQTFSLGLEILFFVVILLFARKMQVIYVKSRETFGDLTTTFRENIIGAQVVRIFNAQNKEIRKFDQENADFRDYTIQAIKWSTALRYSGWLMLAFMASFILVYGGWNAYRAYAIGDTSFDLGQFVAFLSYVSMLGMPINQVNNVTLQFVQANAAMVRVRDVLDSMPEIVESPGALPADTMTGEVEFRNVNFGYTSTLVLKDLNLHVPAGTTIALLGTTGSGKSTLISLLPRFYDIHDGELLYDGVDIKRYQIGSLRKQIAVCSQNIFLFNISIADNIRYGRPQATIEEVVAAAKAANIHEFIVGLPEGYNTLVGERGVSLSGGQKQRVAIARALITKPKVLILDDSTSSVDMETEYKIQQALEKVMRGRTTFIITQRLSTIRNADGIVVMDQGRIVGQGRHDELYRKNALYTQIYETLFSKQKQGEYSLPTTVKGETTGGGH